MEKVRAIMTRRGIKARDFLDVFIISKNSKLQPRDFKKEIIQKTRLMLDKYGKYTTNIKNKDFSHLDKLILGEEEQLLIGPIQRGFENFLKKFKISLEGLLKDLDPISQK